MHRVDTAGSGLSQRRKAYQSEGVAGNRLSQIVIDHSVDSELYSLVAIPLSARTFYMVNTELGRFTSAFCRSLGVFLLSVPLGTNAVEIGISNGIPDGTVGSYRVNVETGGQTRTVFVTAARFASNDTFTTGVVSAYYSFADPGIDGLAFRLSDSETVHPGPFADPNNPNLVTSSGSFFGVHQNVISWTAVSSIAPGAQVMTNTYTFTARTGVLGPLRFLQYLDENIQGPTDDVFFSTGLAGSGDLKLFSFDNTEVYGLSHSGALLAGTELQNASFAGWAADRFNNMQPRITGAGQPVLPDGFIANLQDFRHPQLGPVLGPADIVSVMAWDVDPTADRAVITTSLGVIPSFLGGIPISGQTAGIRPVGNQLRCQRKNCTFRATCVLPPSPGARCTNQIDVTVIKKALRASGGAAGKGRRVPFASGTASVTPGQTGNVRLPLTKRGRKFVRSGTKKKIKGLMEIRNVAGTGFRAIPITIRINR